jgi:hypothetical protein
VWRQLGPQLQFWRLKGGQAGRLALIVNEVGRLDHAENVVDKYGVAGYDA